jgi:putative tricarboxylic transport membrane protein
VEFFSRNGRAGWSLLVFATALALLADLHLTLHFKSQGGELGPAFWPRLWLWTLLGLSAFDFAVELRKAHRRPRAIAPKSLPQTEGPPADLRLVVVGTLLAVIYALATTLIGFALATAIFLIGFSWLGGYRRLLPLLLIALVTTLVLLYVFVQVVYISLPLGQGPFVDLNVALYRLLGIF